MGFISNQMFFFTARINLFLIRSGLLIIFILLVASLNTFATHLRAGNITVTNVSANGCGTTFNITITVYTDGDSDPNDSDVLFGGDGAVLDFGDGNTFLVPYVQNQDVDVSRLISK